MNSNTSFSSLSGYQNGFRENRRFIDPSRHRARIDALKFQISLKENPQGKKEYTPRSISTSSPAARSVTSVYKNKISSFFEKIAVLTTCAATKSRFQTHLAQIEWPFTEPFFVSQVTPANTQPPPSWSQKASQWARLRSHLRLLEDALTERVRSLLIIEDNVRFVPDFSQQVSTLIAQMPSTWHYIDFCSLGYGYALHQSALQHAYSILADSLNTPPGGGEILEKQLKQLAAVHQHDSYCPKPPLIFFESDFNSTPVSL